MIRVIHTHVEVSVPIINATENALSSLMGQHDVLKVSDIWHECWISKRVSLDECQYDEFDLSKLAHT